MKQLFFKSEYLNLIKLGIKTQTIRNWKTLKKFETNQIVNATNRHENINIIITQCYFDNFNNLTDKDAEQDGFKNKKQLKNELIKFYGNSLNKIVVIKFKLA